MTAGVRSAARSFVGRERELRELLAGLDDACDARGRIFLLVGEAGIGKTRTTEELAAAARARGALVLVGRSYESEGAPPYWPWVQILRELTHDADAAILRADMGRGAADIARVIEPLPQPLAAPAAPPLEADQARFRFFDSLTTFFKNAARRRPLVFILDDLHWADHPSLLLLQFIAREIAGAALLVVGTYRDVAIDRHHPFVDTLAELAREPASRLIALRGLSELDVASFMEGAGGSAPPAAVVTVVHQRTEGNPFFISQLVRLLAPEGHWLHAEQIAASTIPSGVQEVLAERLGRLSPACQQVLRVAAVAGRAFDLRVVAAAAGSTVALLAEPLEEARRQRLIGEVAGTVHGYIFAHVLIRDALYSGLSGRERAQLHLAVGEGLEAVYPTAPDSRLAALAYHFFEAAPGGGHIDKAITYAYRAAEHAKAALAWEEAARCYELALRTLARETAAPAAGAAEPPECALLLALGEAHHNANNRPAAREAFQQAAEHARRSARPELLARAALGFAGVVIGVAVDPSAVSVLEEALAALGPHDSGLRAMLLSRLAMELFFSPDLERRTAASTEAVATATRAGDTLALVHALEARHFAIWGPSTVTERLTLADDMLRLAATVDNVDLVMHAHNLRINDLLELGRIEEVDAGISAYARLAEELRQPSYQWGVGMCRAMRAIMDGRFAEAEELATAALMLGQRVQPQTAANFFAAQLSFIRRAQGRAEELIPGLQAALEAFPTVPAWRCALAGLYAEIGRTAEAEPLLAEIAAADFRDLPRDNSWLAAVTLLAETCHHLRDRRCARLLYDALLPYAGQVVVAGIASVCVGSVAHWLGLLATTLERVDVGAAHFDQALMLHRRLGARPLVARTQCAYAALLLLGCGDQPAAVARARALLDEAHESARGLGMAALETTARALLDRFDPSGPGQHVSTALAHAPSGPEENVFRREDDHWTLVFEGRTCRLKNAKGLGYIARLLQAPHRPIHVTDLSGGATGAAPSDTAREQLRDLAAQLDEAEELNDLGAVARLRGEMDTLTRALSRRMGLEPEPGDTAADLLRLRVTKAIKAALRKISTQHPALGHHLHSTIHTGAFCSYVPDPTKPPRWR